MDVFGALSQAADVSKPGFRDRLPTAAIVLVSFYLILAGAPNEVDFAQANAEIGDQSIIGAGALVLALMAATILFDPFLTLMDRILQGDIPGIYGRKRRMRKRKIAERLREQRSSLWRRFVWYDKQAGDTPSDASLSPSDKAEWQRSLRLVAERARAYPYDAGAFQGTNLGNILAAVEERAAGRYGLVTVLALPRLRSLLPVEATNQFDAVEDDLRFAVRMSSASLMTFLVTSILLAQSLMPRFGHVNLSLAWVPLLFLMMSYSSYRTAMAAALKYGEVLSVLFDLHRFLLYDKLHLVRPASPEEEREMAKNLSIALENGRHPNQSYVVPSADSE